MDCIVLTSLCSVLQIWPTKIHFASLTFIPAFREILPSNSVNKTFVITHKHHNIWSISLLLVAFDSSDEFRRSLIWVLDNFFQQDYLHWDRYTFSLISFSLRVCKIVEFSFLEIAVVMVDLLCLMAAIECIQMSIFSAGFKRWLQGSFLLSICTQCCKPWTCSVIHWFDWFHWKYFHLVMI